MVQNHRTFQRRQAVYDPSREDSNLLVFNAPIPVPPPKNLAAEERLRAGTGRFSTRRFFHYNFISDSGIPDSGSGNPKMISGVPETIRGSPEIRFDLQEVRILRRKAVFLE
jgi:hypothetical protein